MSCRFECKTTNTKYALPIQGRDASDRASGMQNNVNDNVVQSKHTIATAATISRENASGLNRVAIGTGLSESLNTLLYRLTRAVCCRNESA